MTRLHVLSLALIVLSGLSAPTRADEVDLEELQQLVDQGTEHFAAGRFEKALALYENAYEGSKAPGALFMVARCHQKLGHWAEAVRAFTVFLESEDVREEDRGQAKMALKDIEARLRTGTLILHVLPLGADVRVDGESAGKAPIDPLDLARGRHDVTVEATGFEKARRAIEVPGGERTTVSIALRELTPEPAAAEPAPEAQAVPNQYTPWTWVTLGVGAAAAIAGSVSYGLGEMDHRKITGVDGYGDDASGMSERRASQLEKSGDTKKLAGYALWGVGGASLVASTVLFLLDATSDHAESSVSVGMAPTPGGGQLSLGARF